jgi:hypothetical protein
VAVVGLAAVAVAAIAHVGAAGDLAVEPAAAAATKAWTFGLTVAGFGTVKFAIAIVLVGIVLRLWVRVDSVKAALRTLTGTGGTVAPLGAFDSEYGSGNATTAAPESLTIHRMAKTMWLPMLAMGVMALAAGLVAAFLAAGGALVGQVMHRQRQPPRGVVRDRAGIGQPRLDKAVGHPLAQILRGACLHAGGDFLGKQFDEQIGHVSTLRAEWGNRRGRRCRRTPPRRNG